MITAEELVAFEEEIADLFNRGLIKSPVHLRHGGEKELIDIFKDVRPQDWVLTTWRSHYQCLLKGVPRDLLKEKILAGYSIALNFPEYRIVSSAIVGGILPIAIGLGMAIQRSGEDVKVYVFIGDMTAETGIAHESVKYAWNHNLPVHFIIEDNGISVCTPTKKAWGLDLLRKKPKVKWYSYKAEKWPHAGGGTRVQF